ncbi:MAG: LPS export ABC transporter ATP-binding protein [Myxococcota bacterium]|nr:LPS export ABC transporter ATP-binding protein [Myxococcota bacterium]
MTQDAPATDAGLQISGLVRRFGRKQVVAGVDLQVPPGQLVGLLGPNGAGKTTIFRMIVGLLRPDSGRVFLDGRDLTALPIHRRAQLGLGYLAQAPSVFTRMTVRDNLLAALELRGRRGREAGEVASRFLAEFGLEEVADRSAGRLSGGERRRTEIARALCAEPSVLILDEPFAAIDPRMAAEIGRIVRDLRARGLGLLLTDHGARQLLPLCDQVAVLLDGAVVARGSAEEIVADPVVRERYLGRDFTV